jgi:predicted MFS family arabinose efflux permease
MNGSLFAILLYLVLYLQDALGFFASGTGVRLLIITAGMFVAATVSGRVSPHVPVRWLIGPGLLLVGVGLALMSGLNGTSSSTHLIPGFLIAGIGSGLVNPPLASTAVGVVEPHRAGMASGVNATFRQVGIAVATAALGTIFTAAVRPSLHHGLAAHAAFAAGRNDLLLVAAGVALVGGLASMALIRSRDFVHAQAASAGQSPELSRPVEASA